MISKEYLAGLFDGEGCIMLIRQGKSGAYKLVMALTNTNREIMDDVQSQYGGHLLMQDSGRGENRKPVYRIVWSAKKAIAMIEFLLPELRIKKKQAIVAIKFQALRSDRKKTTEHIISKRGRRLSASGVAMYESLRGEMSALNKRGIA